MVGGHECLPHLTLLALAVAQDGVDLNILPLVLGAQGHAHRQGDALAQRAAGGVHAGDLLHIRVALENTVELPEIGELRLVKKTQLRQHAVIAGSGVALAENEPVPVRIFRILGVHAHFRKNAAHQLHRRQGAAGVAAARVGRHVDDVPADLGAEFFQFRCVHGDAPPFIIYHKPSIPHNSRIVNHWLSGNLR